jgi:hypothetical protein
MSPRILGLAPALLLAAGAALAGDVVTRDGRNHVLNEKPALDPVTLELEELWRAGGEGNADDLVFGVPVEAVADAEGRVYLADQQLCQVFVFEPDGTLAGTLSREGEGPGEVRIPVDLVRLPDGTFGLAEFFPGRITKVTADDEPAGRIEVDVAPGETGGFTIQTMVEAKGDHLLVAGSRSVPKDRVLERIHFLAAINPDGTQSVRYMEQRSEIERPHSVVHENDFLPPFPLASALGADGRVYTPWDREKYQVAVFKPDGAVDRVIERPDFKAWKRDDRDTKRVLALFESWAGANPETWPEFDLLKTERTINTLHIDGQDRLWVQHSRSNRDLPDGVFLNLDLYDRAGNWQREVRLVCEGNPVSDGIRFLGDGRVLLIKGFVVSRLACLGSGNATLGDDDTKTLEIICYRLPEI